MVGKSLRIVASSAVILMVIAALVVVFAPHGTSPSASAADTLTSALSNAKNEAINTAIDNSGAKTAVENALLAYSEDISKQTGLADGQVQQMIRDMDIQSWEVATLPTDACENNSISGSYAGVNATITTYDDPNYVTVNAYGQDVTLSVPNGAQKYLPLLKYAP